MVNSDDEKNFQTGPLMAAVSIKLPPFWPNDPTLWFAQVESQFVTRGITVESTKFHHVVGSLSPEAATEVRDIILSGSSTHSYSNLKKALIDRSTESERKRLQRLILNEDIGDLKPTKLLRKMEQLLGDRSSTFDSTFLKELFIQRLPKNVQMILAPSIEKLEIIALAEMADKIMETSNDKIANVTANRSNDQRDEIIKLKKEVALLKKQMGIKLPNFSKTKATDRSDNICWYHRKFGSNATKCSPPCSNQLKGQASH